MIMWEGKEYRDDRLYYMDLVFAETKAEKPWTVITRENTEENTPFRVDSFRTERAAVDYIIKVEPATPRISLNGKSPIPAPTYDGYCRWLELMELPSSLQIYQASMYQDRKIVVEPVSPGEFEAKLAEKPEDD